MTPDSICATRSGGLLLIMLGMMVMMPTVALPQDSVGFRPRLSGRYAALGDVSAAEVFDASGLYGNPASLSFLDNISVAATHHQEIRFPWMSERIAARYSPARYNTFGIGVSVDHLGPGNRPNPGEYPYSEYGIDLAYAREIIPMLSLGGRFGFENAQGGLSQLRARSFSIGGVYYPDPGTSYGISYSTGTDIAVVRGTTGVRIESQELPRILKVGAVMQFPASKRERVFVLALENTKFLGEGGTWYHLGVEFYPVRFIAARIGYVTGSSGALARCGFGVCAEGFEVDYAVSPNGSNEEFHEVSLSVEL